MSGERRLACYRRWKALTGAVLGTIALLTAIGSGLIWAADQRYQRVGDVEQVQQDLNYLTRVILEERLIEAELRIDYLESIAEPGDRQRRELFRLRRQRDEFKSRLDQLSEDGGEQ